MATPNKQIGWGAEASLLQSIAKQLNNLKSSMFDLQNDVGIIDESSENIVYYCYPKKGTTSVNDATWAILRISTESDVATYEWAGGTKDKIHKASDRGTLTYSFL